MIYVDRLYSGYSGDRLVPGRVRHVLPAVAPLLRREVLPGPRASSRRLAVQPHPAPSRSVLEVRLLQRLPELQEHLPVVALRRHRRQVCAGLA